MENEAQPQEQLIGGGPYGEAPRGQDTTEGAPQEQATEGGGGSEADGAAPVAQAPIFRGISREISDMGELTKYTLELERKTLELEARAAGFAGLKPQEPVQGSSAPAASSFDSRALGEEIILNPAGAVEKIVSHVRNSIMGDIQRNASSDSFYKAFYDANEDLVGCEDLVNMTVQQRYKEWENVPADKAALLLAQEVRTKADRIRGSAPREQVLSSRAPHALPPSGGAPAPKPAPAAPPKVLTFAEQLKSQQSRHKKRA